ncbi:MAG: peptidylprolyl isomerase [Oscillospiraceae bacterium]
MKVNGKVRLTSFFLILATALTLCSGCVTMGRRNPTATITFSNGVEIVVRLYYDKAPNTVKNFIYLAESGFYNGLKVHRVVKYNLIQMGDPNGDGTGDAGYCIKGEFPNNGYKKNDLSLTEGMVAMGRLGSTNDDSKYYDTASCQFFITVNDKSHTLDGDYAVFGKVIKGYEEFQEMQYAEVDENKCPLEDIFIESITIETFGENYGKPKTIKKKDA